MQSEVEPNHGLHKAIESYGSEPSSRVQTLSRYELEKKDEMLLAVEANLVGLPVAAAQLLLTIRLELKKRQLQSRQQP